MATTAQSKANRENATHSTGPTSDAGKATSCRNGLKHGLSTGHLLIPNESEEEFNTLLAGLIENHQPANITETMLVQDMAKHHWLADRAVRLQNYNMASFGVIPVPPGFAVLIRYQTANERAYHRALTTLNALQKTRLAAIGSASKSVPEAAAPPPQPVHATPTDLPSCEKLLEMFEKGFEYNYTNGEFQPMPPE